MENNLNYVGVNCCPLCESYDYISSPLNIGSYSFNKINLPLNGIDVKICNCQNCGLYYKSTVPTRSSLSSLYNEQAEEVWNGLDYNYDREKKLLNTYGLLSGTFIDVGSSNGNLLRSISKYFELSSGLDVYCDNNCADKITGEYLIGFVEDEDLFSKHTYGLITAFDVFEHFYDPGAAMRTFIRVGDRNHHVLLETGDADSVTSVSNWWYAKLIEHHIFWNKKSIMFACNKFGYEIVEYKRLRHKSRLNLSYIKIFALFTLSVLGKNRMIDSIIYKLTKIRGSMVGNPFALDHLQVLLRKI